MSQSTDLIGRFRQMAAWQRAPADGAGAGELVGIETGETSAG
jgi:hypothetical protein